MVASFWQKHPKLMVSHLNYLKSNGIGSWPSFDVHFLTSISFAHLTNIPITPIDACIYKLIVFSSFGQNDYKTLQKRSNNSRTSTIAFWYAISIIMTSLSVKIRWLRRQYYACHCSIQQISTFFNGQIVFFVFFPYSHWRGEIIKWFIACLLIHRKYLTFVCLLTIKSLLVTLLSV